MQTELIKENGTIPPDLSCSLGMHALLCRTYQAVEAASSSEPQGTPAKVLLSLLTYAYSTGVYGSAEIETARTFDRAIRYITQGYAPTADEIRQYRRRCSELVEAALTSLFALTSGNSGLALREARRRVHLAIRTDSAWLDA